MDEHHGNTHAADNQPKYIDGVGWRRDTIHRMTRWPEWKDSRKPGTYMFTLNVNGARKVLGTLHGTTAAVYTWMAQHPEATTAASADPLYYRHVLLATRSMPFVLPSSPAADEPTAATPPSPSAAAATPPSPAADEVLVQCRFDDIAPASPSAAAVTPPSPTADEVLVQCRFDDIAYRPHRKTHFPIEALSAPDAPHIVLSPLGEKVKAAWQRMPAVVPQIDHISLAIMPNHLHAIIAVREELPRALGAVIRSFMGTTTHALRQLIASDTVRWDADTTTSSDPKPSLWEQGYCVGVCKTEENLHTRIGYVLENPFFGILEHEQTDFMQRAHSISVAGRQYGAYGNILLLKEPDRIQVFCHRKHPVTQEPYHLTQDYRDEKAAVLSAVSNGAVVVTPGISPGESDIMWSVLQAGGCVINVQKQEIDSKWHPEKERRLYCSQGKMLVLAVHDLPNQVFHDRWGQQIPADTNYVRFHLLNLVAAELCAEGIEHACRLTPTKTHQQP